MNRKCLAVMAVLGLLIWCGGCDKTSSSFNPDFSTPEKALQSLEDAYRSKNLENVLMCKDFELEAKFFLDNTAGSVSKEVVHQHAEMLEARFKKLVEERFPEWKGVAARITDKEELPGDMVIITEELDLPDGKKMTQRVFVGKSEHGWKALMPYSDKMKDGWLKNHGGGH